MGRPKKEKTKVLSQRVKEKNYAKLKNKYLPLIKKDDK